MNIGIVTTWFERGAAYVSRQYMNALARNNNVYIYARAGEKYAIGDPKWDMENVTWGKRKNEYPTDIDIPDFVNWIKNNNIDTILFNEQWYWEPILVARKMGVKVGAYVDYYKIDTVPAFKIYDFIICNTKRHYSVFKDFEQCFYVPWGTDVDVFVPQKRNILNKTVVFFMSVGYDPKRKGADLAIKAFSRFDKSLNIKLLIHTQVNLEDKINDCSNIIIDLTKAGKLEIINKTVTAPGLYHMADIYLYPSWLDGIGLTLAEAISCGLPVITTDMPPMNEFGNSGFVKLARVDRQICREDAYYWPLSIVSVDSLYQCMEYFVNNLHKLEKMKQDARNYAIKDLNWMDNSVILDEIFNNTIIRSVDDNVILNVKAIDKNNSLFEYRALRFMKRLDIINNKLACCNGKVGIYCAGIHTKKLLEFSDILKYDLQGIIDKHPIEKMINGIKVMGISEMKNNVFDSIVISSYKYQEDVFNELAKRGYQGVIIKLYDENDDGEFYDV